MASEFRGIEVFGRQSRRPSTSGRRARRPVPNQPAPNQPAPRQSWRRQRLGMAAAGAGAATVVATIAGIGTAEIGRFLVGTLFAYLGTGTSVVAVLCGAAAVVTRRGRAWGAVGIVLGVLASPPVLTRVLAWASGLG